MSTATDYIVITSSREDCSSFTGSTGCIVTAIGVLGGVGWDRSCCGSVSCQEVHIDGGDVVFTHSHM